MSAGNERQFIDYLQRKQQLEDTILDLMGRYELSEDEVKQLQGAEEELERLENANSK